MITYWQLIHCKWIKVTTSVVVWMKLPHVVSWTIKCGVVAAVVIPPVPNTHIPIPSPWTDYEHVPALLIRGLEGGQQRTILIPPADVVNIPEPSSLDLFSIGAGVVFVSRLRKRMSN